MIQRSKSGKEHMCYNGSGRPGITDPTIEMKYENTEEGRLNQLGIEKKVKIWASKIAL